MKFPGLYSCFAHWLNHDHIYIYSDPHFFESDMYQIRNGLTLKDEVTDRQLLAFDNAHIDTINAFVGKNDMLIILGDIGKIDRISQLKAGYKVLIKGNHDMGSANYRRGLGYLDRSVKPPVYVHEDNHLFDEVYDGPLYIHEKIILSHEPVATIGALNIHGHVHGLKNYGSDECNYVDLTAWAQTFEEGSAYAWLNVCAEQIAYIPVDLKAVATSGILKRIDDIHRLTINRASGK